MQKKILTYLLLLMTLFMCSCGFDTDSEIELINGYYIKINDKDGIWGNWCHEIYADNNSDPCASNLYSFYTIRKEYIVLCWQHGSTDGIEQKCISINTKNGDIKNYVSLSQANDDLDLNGMEWHKLSEYSKTYDVYNPYSRLSVDIYKSCNENSFNSEESDIYAVLDSIYSTENTIVKDDVVESNIKKSNRKIDGFLNIDTNVSDVTIFGTDYFVEAKAEQKIMFDGLIRTQWSVSTIKEETK